ncbi:MAG: hypothetical protein ACTSPK_07890 [Candidatus Heimdallarchaeota archaeon]
MKSQIRKIFRNKKAVSAVISMVLILGATVLATGIIYGVTSQYLDFDSKIQTASGLTAEDSNGDNLIDFMTFSLLNKGLENADIKSIIVHEGDNALLWYTLDTGVRMSEVEELNIYALSLTQQLTPLAPFYIEVVFEEGSFNTAGYTITLATELPEEMIPIIESGGDSGIAFNFLVERTKTDDEYASKKFPASVGYSPNLWFVLGAFEDNVKRPNLNNDYIDLNGFGVEEDYQPHLVNDDQFTAGNIGTQSSYEVMPYNDSGDNPGLVAFDKYGRWDKNDNLNWGKRGIAYMWSYIYVSGTSSLDVSVGANGATEYQVFVNGEHIITGTKHNRWYTNGGITLNPGLNLVMMKISAKTNAHFAGQVLFYNNAQLSNLYSVWPTAADL